MIVSFFVLVVILALSVPAAIVFVPLTMITRNAGPLYAVGCWIARVGFRVAGIRVAIEGRERVPKGKACIFMANHVSNLDPPALVPHLPGRCAAFTKQEIFKIPVFGYCLRLGDFIPVDRKGSVAAAQDSMAAAQRVLNKGLHIMTFVEGTRSKSGRMLPFKKGPFYLAQAAGAPCVPVSIYGTESLMAKGSMKIKRGTVHLVFHEPIDPGRFSTREELMHAVRETIASGLPEWMRG